jgi:SAM-dependent methyltransferase
MLQHAAEIAEQLIQERGLDGKSLVVEIASNDGYLLKNYQQAGVPTLGIEPAYNVAEVARKQHNIPTISEFFGSEFALRLRADGYSADVIHANNVLAHVPEINGFVEGFATLLKPTGVAVIETPYVKYMIERCEFDTIYHEHVFYYSLTAINALLRRHGLYLQDVEVHPIHGGTLRVLTGKENHDRSGRVAALLMEEAAWVDDTEFYLAYSKSVKKQQEDLRNLLRSLKSQGKRIAAYGAAAKGSTLLNTAGIGTDLIDFAVDRNTHKQGLYMSGCGLQIFPPEELLRSQPDYVLLLTWNFAEEIIRQQAEYLKRGGQFITSHPYPHVLPRGGSSRQDG